MKQKNLPIGIKFSLLLFAMILYDQVYTQSIYTTYWYSDSTQMCIKIRKHGFSLLTDGADSLSGVKFRKKGKHLIFIQKYWGTFYYRSIKQDFIILKLTEDTLIIAPYDKKNMILYSILEINLETKTIVFTSAINGCNYHKEMSYYRKNDD